MKDKVITAMGRVTGRPTGVRLTKRQADSCRAKIRTTQLINRLQANANNELEKEMSTGQVRSAEILLNKTLPNLSATELKADVSNTVEAMSDAELLAMARRQDKAANS